MWERVSECGRVWESLRVRERASECGRERVSAGESE